MIRIQQTDMIINIESVMEVNKITSEQEKIFSRLVSSFGKEKKIKQKKYKKKTKTHLYFILYVLTSVCILSILFSIQLLRSDQFLYSRNLNV